MLFNIFDIWYFLGKRISLFKGYLCYKVVISQNVSFQAQVKNFFIL